MVAKHTPVSLEIERDRSMIRIPDPVLALICGALLGCLCAAFV